MKKICILFLLALFVTAEAQLPQEKGYTLLFEEHFNGDTLNLSHWRYREDRRMTGLNRKENITVSDGYLHIALRQEIIDGTLENTGGGVISNHQFGYGYYELLSKPFTKGGVHSAFWQSKGIIPNNDIFEIDSYEIYGDNKMANNNFYLHIKPRNNEYVPYPYHAVNPFTVDENGWFLDAYEYTPQGVIFYDNGKEVGRSDWGELTAQQCIWITAVNLRVKKNENLPDDALIDYFRYYAKDYPGVNILPNGNFEYNSGRKNRYEPIAWQQQGTPNTCIVIDGDAYRDRSKLRINHEESFYKIKLFQNLEFIMNGEYMLSAMVRSSGRQEEAKLYVYGTGEEEKSVNFERCDNWTRIEIPGVKVSNNSATIAVSVKAAPNQWIEIDNIEFMKPAPSIATVIETEPFNVDRDPFWSMAQNSPLICHGDGMIIGLSGNIGTGNALSISLQITAQKRDNMSVFAKIPKTGKSGRGIYLRENGDVVFRIGSRTNYTDIIAPDAYQSGKPCRITCVYDYGTARLYINNKLVKEVHNLSQDTNAPGGRFGDVMGVFTPIDDKSIQNYHDQNVTDSYVHPVSKFSEFVGELYDVKFYHRALEESEANNL